MKSCHPAAQDGRGRSQWWSRARHDQPPHLVRDREIQTFTVKQLSIHFTSSTLSHSHLQRIFYFTFCMYWNMLCAFSPLPEKRSAQCNWADGRLGCDIISTGHWMKTLLWSGKENWNKNKHVSLWMCNLHVHLVIYCNWKQGFQMSEGHSSNFAHSKPFKMFQQWVWLWLCMSHFANYTHVHVVSRFGQHHGTPTAPDYTTHVLIELLKPISIIDEILLEFHCLQ